MKNELLHRGQALTSITLRDINEPGDRRLLTAELKGDGTLEIHGLDRGDAVEKYFGYREYEWYWTLSAEEVTKLQGVLGTDRELMTALAERFSGDQAADLKAFLDANQIQCAVWSRNGD